MSEYGKAVILERVDGVGKLTINRPEKRNSLNMAVATEMVAALEECRGDEAVKTLILTGAGDVAFCAGNDLTEFRDRWTDPVRSREYSDAVFGMHETIRNFPKVVIAAVNGYCLGGGITLLLSCHLAIAAEKARFGLPEVIRGSWPALATTASLHAMLPRHAMYLILTGKNVDAREAVWMGLVNRVVPDDQLEAETEALAKELASYNPLVLQWAKEVAYKSMGLDYDHSMAYGQAAASAFRTISDSFREGIVSFVSGEGPKAR